MMKGITIVPYGSLQKETATDEKGRLTQPGENRQTLKRLLKTIGIAGSRIQLVMVNHRPAGMDSMVGSGDRVALFPKEYPIFVDWQAYRNVGS